MSKTAFKLIVENGNRIYKVKQGREPWQTFRDGDPIPAEWKAVFDRSEADLEAFANDPKVKTLFDEMEKELKQL